MTERRDAYQEGRKAGLEGKKFWENPYTDKNGFPDDFRVWFAGWCAGRKGSGKVTAIELIKEVRAQASQDNDQA